MNISRHEKRRPLVITKKKMFLGAFIITWIAFALVPPYFMLEHLGGPRLTTESSQVNEVSADEIYIDLD